MGYVIGGIVMEAEIKVEFEIKAFGEETITDYEDSWKGFEIARTKTLSKETTLENIETIINQLFDEIQLSYGKQPEQLVAKVLIRAKKQEAQITYLG